MTAWTVGEKLLNDALTKAVAHLEAASKSANAAVPVVHPREAAELHVAVAHAAIRLLEVTR